jgi:hypothetical protein
MSFQFSKQIAVLVFATRYAPDAFNEDDVEKNDSKYSKLHIKGYWLHICSKILHII